MSDFRTGNSAKINTHPAIEAAATATNTVRLFKVPVLVVITSSPSKEIKKMKDSFAAIRTFFSTYIIRRANDTVRRIALLIERPSMDRDCIGGTMNNTATQIRSRTQLKPTPNHALLRQMIQRYSG